MLKAQQTVSVGEGQRASPDRGAQIHRGAGHIRESAVERRARDLRPFRPFEGTSQIQQLVIMRQLLKNAEALCLYDHDVALLV